MGFLFSPDVFGVKIYVVSNSFRRPTPNEQQVSLQQPCLFFKSDFINYFATLLMMS